MLEGNPRPVVALAGLQLTRKALFCDVARRRGYAVVSVGDYLRRAESAGGEPRVSDATPGALDFDDEERLLARALASDGNWQHAPALVLDSIKSTAGLSYLRSAFTAVAVVACLAPLRQRWRAALERKRADAPTSLDAFQARDEREIAMGLGSVVLRADFFFLAGDRQVSTERAESILNAIDGAGDDG